MVRLEKDDLVLVVDPDDGMTVTSILYKGMETVQFDQERRKSGATYGIPLLFPTPNRVSGGSFDFDGLTIPAVMHGPFRHKVFSVRQMSPDHVYAECGFDPSDKYFPYCGRLGIAIGIADDAVSWTFTVRNEGVRPFAYGLALHPFFLKRDGGVFSANVVSLMLSDDDKIPSGKVEDVSGSALDFRKPTQVSLIDTDSVFITDGAMRASLDFGCYRIDMDSYGGFEHVVVYTSPDRPFICVEPQSCSTDAHNLYNKGYAEESGLITAVPGAVLEHGFSLRFN